MLDYTTLRIPLRAHRTQALHHALRSLRRDRRRAYLMRALRCAGRLRAASQTGREL